MPKFVRGHPRYGGRRKGVPSKAKAEKLQAEAEARVRLAAACLASQGEIEQAALRMHTMSPLEVMLTGMHLKLGRGDLDGAQKIAEAAAPYTSPKLNATDVCVLIGLCRINGLAARHLGKSSFLRIDRLNSLRSLATRFNIMELIGH